MSESSVHLQSISSVPITTRVDKATIASVENIYPTKKDALLVCTGDVGGDEVDIREEQSDSHNGQNEIDLCSQSCRLLNCNL